MLIEVVTVPDCPNASTLLRRIRDVVGHDAPISVRVLDLDEPAPHGFAGSPTLLIDGENPFGVGDAPSAACVLQLPSIEDLRSVLQPG